MRLQRVLAATAFMFATFTSSFGKNTMPLTEPPINVPPGRCIVERMDGTPYWHASRPKNKPNVHSISYDGLMGMHRTGRMRPERGPKKDMHLLLVAKLDDGKLNTQYQTIINWATEREIPFSVLPFGMNSMEYVCAEPNGHLVLGIDLSKPKKTFKELEKRARGTFDLQEKEYLKCVKDGSPTGWFMFQAGDFFGPVPMLVSSNPCRSKRCTEDEKTQMQALTVDTGEYTVTRADNITKKILRVQTYSPNGYVMRGGDGQPFLVRTDPDGSRVYEEVKLDGSLPVANRSMPVAVEVEMLNRFEMARDHAGYDTGEGGTETLRLPYGNYVFLYRKTNDVPATPPCAGLILEPSRPVGPILEQYLARLNSAIVGQNNP